MPARRKSRHRAVQVLFLWDVRKLPIDDAIQAFYDSLITAETEEETGEEPAEAPAHDAFMESLVRGTSANVVELDSYIAKRAENWRLERMPIVDRNLLRMAVYEMKHVGTPPAVVIDEALELARRYSEEEAVPFLNGVLDAVRKVLFPPNSAEAN
ncbi:transcription antitermination factor NusB [Paludibaculum fermentans]|uniref:Transcription antitermination protein NusB n=1 Tax=Paludibaculum fermentans TaxID=1473598 RepID=A0A7S7NL11_PALFE|nr:transcription antitermination factor NusB [Paludibaculum fermentans]QOY85577.1 transcription antitermination factor NusB [Paludibaculum fermentans]